MKNLLRNLAYASMIIAALATAAHQLRGEATAQSPLGEIAGMSVEGDRVFVIMVNGDVYKRMGWFGSPNPTFTQPLEFVGNLFDGGAPTNFSPRSWSEIKAGSGR